MRAGLLGSNQMLENNATKQYDVSERESWMNKHVSLIRNNSQKFSVKDRAVLDFANRKIRCHNSDIRYILSGGDSVVDACSGVKRRKLCCLIYGVQANDYNFLAAKVEADIVRFEDTIMPIQASTDDEAMRTHRGQEARFGGPC